MSKCIHIPIGSMAWSVIAQSQVMERCQRLTGTAAPEPPDAAALTEDIREQAEPAAKPARPVFHPDGSSRAEARIMLASDLNRSTAPLPIPRPAEICLDEPLRLKSGCQYDFGGVVLRPAALMPFLFELDNCEEVALAQARVILDCHSAGGVRLRQCRHVRVTDCHIENGTFGIVLRDNNTGVVLSGNTIRNTARAGVFVQGENRLIWILGNLIDTLHAASNWAAGIVLASVPILDTDDLARDFWEDYHWPKHGPLRACLRGPHAVLVESNTVVNSRSSGIYCDGSYDTVVTGNILRGCDKEGLCLDNGTFRTVVAGNVIEHNGRRARQTDEDLFLDFVLPAGRAPDGSSRSKLPGISMDNALANVVRHNLLRGNWGGGVKMVRTAFLNRIENNLIEGNSPWRTDDWRFHGVLLDGAPADCANPDLDFAGSHGNLISGNLIAGHDTGICLAADSSYNRIEDNVLLNHRWALAFYGTGQGNKVRRNRARDPLLGVGWLSRARAGALRWMRATATRQPNTEFVRMARACAIIRAVRAGNLDAGLRDGAVLLTEFPDFVWFRGHYAHWLAAAGQREAALAEYERLARENPSDPEVRRWLDQLRSDADGA